MDFVPSSGEHLLSHMIRNNVSIRARSYQDLHHRGADPFPMIIDALRCSYPSFLGDMTHGKCMPTFQEVDLICNLQTARPRQVVALDQGNDLYGPVWTRLTECSGTHVDDHHLT